MERKRNDGNEQAREADEQNEAETLIDAQFEFGPLPSTCELQFRLGPVHLVGQPSEKSRRQSGPTAEQCQRDRHMMNMDDAKLRPLDKNS